MGIRALALRISSLQYKFVWKMNDIHIFTSQTIPVLDQARREYAESDWEGDLARCTRSCTCACAARSR
jgi:hypothetical protein